MDSVVGIKLRKHKRVLECAAGELQLSVGDKVIVDTEAGAQLGTVVPRIGKIVHVQGVLGAVVAPGDAIAAQVAGALLDQYG